jgi:hypothetical protein
MKPLERLPEEVEKAVERQIWAFDFPQWTCELCDQVVLAALNAYREKHVKGLVEAAKGIAESAPWEYDEWCGSETCDRCGSTAKIVNPFLAALAQFDRGEA